MLSRPSVGLFLDGGILWASRVDASMVGGRSSYHSSFKFDLSAVPEEAMRKTNLYTDAVTQIVARTGLKSKVLGMAFAEADTFVRYFEIPLIPDSELRSAVGYEAQKYLPFALREVEFDFTVFRRRDSKKQGIVLGAVKKEVLDFWRQVIARAGFDLAYVVPEGFALFRLLKESAAVRSSNEITVYAALRRGGSLTLLAARQDELLMHHTVKVPEPLAVAGEEPGAYDSGTIARQITLALNYFAKTFRSLVVKDIRLLADPKTGQDNLEQVLRSDLNLPVQVLSAQKLFNKSPVELSSAEMIALETARSVRGFSAKLTSGRSLNLAGRGRKGVSAAPQDWEEEKKALGFFVLAEVSVLAACFLFIHLLLMAPVHSGKQTIAFAKKQAAAAGTDLSKPLADLSAESELLAKKSAFLTALTDRRVLWTPKLAELARLMVQGAELDVLEIEDPGPTLGRPERKLRLQGRICRGSEDLTLLNEFVGALRKSENFSQGMGTVLLTKVRKMASQKGDYTSSAFFVDCQPAEGSL